jgi:hypothetical protein
MIYGTTMSSIVTRDESTWETTGTKKNQEIGSQMNKIFSSKLEKKQHLPIVSISLCNTLLILFTAFAVRALGLRP